MKSTSPDAAADSITRRWLPWRRKFKASHRDDATTPLVAAGEGGWGDDLGVLGLIAVAVVLGILIPIGFIFVPIAIELVLLLALLPLAVLGRLFFGRPWEVEVRDTNGGVVWPVVHTEAVNGWVDSSTRIAEISEEVRLGTFTPNGGAR